MKRRTKAKVEACAVVLVFAGVLGVFGILLHAHYEKERRALRHMYTAIPSEQSEEEAHYVEDMQTVLLLKILTDAEDKRSIAYQAGLVRYRTNDTRNSNPEIQAKLQEFKPAFALLQEAIKRAERATAAFESASSGSKKEQARKELYSAKESLLKTFEDLWKLEKEIKALYDAYRSPPSFFRGPMF